MTYHDRGTEQHADDAKMHHFLDTNLHRAKPRVSERTATQPISREDHSNAAFMLKTTPSHVFSGLDSLLLF